MPGKFSLMFLFLGISSAITLSSSSDLPSLTFWEFLFIYWLVYLILAVLGNCCRVSFPSFPLGKWGLFSGCSMQASHWRHSVFSKCGSLTLEHRLSSCDPWLCCSMAYRIILNQGPNSHHLRWQADSLPLNHQRIPIIDFSISHNSSVNKGSLSWIS